MRVFVPNCVQCFLWGEDYPEDHGETESSQIAAQIAANSVRPPSDHVATPDLQLTPAIDLAFQGPRTALRPEEHAGSESECQSIAHTHTHSTLFNYNQRPVNLCCMSSFSAYSQLRPAWSPRIV